MLSFIKNNWKYAVMGIGAAFMLLYFFDPKEEIVKVPVEIEVPVPVVEKEFDTVYVPKPVYISGKKEIDSTYYDKYNQLNDSIAEDKVKKDSLFKEAITINKYKETLEDDTLSINLNMTVRGKLLDYQLGYKTKPRTISLDTVINVPIPTKAKLFGGVGVRLPFNQFNTGGVTPTPYGGLYLKTKKDRLIMLEADLQSVSIGYAWKF